MEKWGPGVGGRWSYGSLVLLAIETGGVLFCCWAGTEIIYAFIAPSKTMSYCWLVTEGSIITHISMWPADRETERAVCIKALRWCITFSLGFSYFPFKSLKNRTIRANLDTWAELIQIKYTINNVVTFTKQAVAIVPIIIIYHYVSVFSKINRTESLSLLREAQQALS